MISFFFFLFFFFGGTSKRKKQIDLEWRGWRISFFCISFSAWLGSRAVFHYSIMGMGALRATVCTEERKKNGLLSRWRLFWIFFIPNLGLRGMEKARDGRADKKRTERGG